MVAYKDNGGLLWTRSLALAVSIPGAVLVVAALVLANLWNATADSHLGTACLVISAIGSTAVIVGVVCGIESALYIRHAARDFPELPRAAHLNPEDARRRIVVRRRNGPIYYFVLTTLAVIVAALIGQMVSRPAMIGVYGVTVVFAGLLMLVIFDGVVAWFVITPEHLRIDSMFRSVRVPRHLIGGFSPVDCNVRLDLTTPDGGSRVDRRGLTFRVDSAIADLAMRENRYRHNRGGQILMTSRIVHAMSAVPAMVTNDREADGEISVQPRRGSFAIATLLALTVPVGIVMIAMS